MLLVIAFSHGYHRYSSHLYLKNFATVSLHRVPPCMLLQLKITLACEKQGSLLGTHAQQCSS